MGTNLEELAEFCRVEGRGSLRGVFTYRADGGDVVYAREDLEEVYGGEGFVGLREAAWEVHETVLEEAPNVRTLGKYRVTVHTFDQGFVMQFRESPEEGVAVVFDRDVGRNLHEFLLECEDYLAAG